MDEEKRLLKICLGVLALLIVGGALWRVLSYKPEVRKKIRSLTENTQMQNISHESVAPSRDIEELLEESPSTRRIAAVGVPPEVALPIPYEKTTSAPDSVYSANRATIKQTYPNSSTSKYEMKPDSYHVNTKTSTQQPRANSSHTTEYATPQVSFNTSASDRIREERSRMLAPYLRPNQQDKARMDDQWNKMFVGLQRAIAKALTPKSKREEMIEKYAAKTAETQALEASGFAGPLAPVGQQIAVQKQLMMQQMGQAFGNAAAEQAGGIIDSFAAEVASILNAPNTTAEQKEQQVKELAKKYQDKLDKLAEKNQYDKFVADRLAQDNKQKEELGSLYPEQRERIGQLIDQTREKDLALATQNLPREEYFNQLAQNEQALRSDIQQLVAQEGQSVQDFHKWEQEQNKKYLQTLAKLEEEGKIRSVASIADADERRETQAGIDAQSPKSLEEIGKTFGEQARADAKTIWDNYEKKLHQIEDEKLSPLERRTQKQNATDEVNRQLIDLRIQYVEKMNIPDEQKQIILGKLHQEYNSI